MLTKGTSFANYSKNLCWIIAVIWLLISIWTFTDGNTNSVINGFLWLAGAVAFAISAMFISKGAESADAAEDEQSAD